MSIRRNFLLWLLSEQDVKTAVGSRVWPMLRPGGPVDLLPALVLIKKPGSVHEDDVGGTTDLRRHQFHIACLGRTYDEADDLFVMLAGRATGNTGLLTGAAAIDMNGQLASDIKIIDDYDGTAEEHLFGDTEKIFIITIVVELTTQTGE